MSTTSLARRALLVATPLVSLLGLLAEIGEYHLGAPERAVELFSLSYEQNVPTWYATQLLFACSLALAAIARTTETRRAHWASLALLFAYMSLDEAIELHEHLAYVYEGEGVLHFGWVVPGAALVLAIGLAFARFLLSLPAPTRTRFVIAGALYVGGALAMELPLGAWVDAHGDDNLGYGVLDWIEETLELVGASVFLVALLRHREHAA